MILARFLPTLPGRSSHEFAVGFILRDSFLTHRNRILYSSGTVKGFSKLRKTATESEEEA